MVRLGFSLDFRQKLDFLSFEKTSCLILKCAICSLDKRTRNEFQIYESSWFFSPIKENRVKIRAQKSIRNWRFSGRIWILKTNLFDWVLSRKCVRNGQISPDVIWKINFWFGTSCQNLKEIVIRFEDRCENACTL